MTLTKKLKEEFLQRFFDFYDHVKGRRDVKSRVEVIANPENLKTMSILTRSQAEFCSIADWVAGVEEWGGMFKGLSDYAGELKAHSISVGGKGRDQAIQFMASLSESKILGKLGLTFAGERKNK